MYIYIYIYIYYATIHYNITLCVGFLDGHSNMGESLVPGSKMLYNMLCGLEQFRCREKQPAEAGLRKCHGGQGRSYGYRHRQVCEKRHRIDGYLA